MIKAPFALCLSWTRTGLPRHASPAARSRAALRLSGVYKSWALCAVLLLFAACKAPTNPPNMNHDDVDMTVAMGCEQMKCENPDSVCCNGEPCVDTQVNPLHCGGCGKTCGAREVCVTGSCLCRGGGRDQACPSDTRCCPDGCRQVQNDTLNCGGCGLACRTGETCQAGLCKCGGSVGCRAGQVCCGSTCSDLQNDAQNCGMCGKTCPMGKACKNGLCEGECMPCGMGETCCNGVCANLFKDNMNCGKCGNVCPGIAGIPFPCTLGICWFGNQDGGMSPPDMSGP